MVQRNPRFAELFTAGREAVTAGRTVVQEPPTDGGPRWGISVVLPPDRAGVRLLDDLTADAMRHVGDTHWPTGAAGSSQFTVRALERHRSPVPGGDERVARYQAAMGRAAKRADVIRLRLTGLTLTPGGVMLCADPLDDAAAAFAVGLADELGEEGWYEADFTRDIWYATLVHFTGPVHDPAALVDWVDARRHEDLGLSVHTHADLVAFRFDGTQTVPVTLGTAQLQT